MRSLALLFALAPSIAMAAKKYPVELTESSYASRPITMMVLVGLLGILPFAAVMLTSFSKIAVVLSIARSAMGTQQAPPTIVLTGLAAVLSGHIMAPVMERMYDVGQAVYQDVGSGAQILSAAGQVT